MARSKFRRNDDSLGWIVRWFRKLENEIREIRSGRSLQAATIADGGLVVKGKGGFTMIAPDGTTIFEVICDPNNPDPNGNPQPSVFLKRNDGTVAMSLNDPMPTADGYHQIWRVFDRTGREIFSEDTTSGTGIATPWLSCSMYPARYTDYLKSSSGSFEDLWVGQFQAMNPCLSLAAAFTSDATGTAGEVRFTVNGTTVGTTQTVGFAIGQAYLANQVPLPGGAKPGDFITIKLQARRTGGSGNICCAPYGIQGAQSA